MGAFPLLTSLTLLPPAIPAGVLTLPLLTSLALLQPAPAQAQSVSNITETTGSTNPVITNRLIANAFTTGGTTADRFTLSSVVLALNAGGNGTFAVSIHNPGTGGNSSNPGTKIGSDLTGTIGSPAGNTTYSAGSGNTITLNGGTTYFVQAAGGGSTDRRVRATTSDSETGAGTWSTATIANTGRLSTNSGTSWSNLTGLDADLNPVNVALRFTVNATAVAKTLTATNKTQTGATLTLANHYAGWWYKRTGPTAGTCTSRTAAQTTATLTGLTAGTSYTYKACSKTGCNTADVIATATFDTLNAPTLTATNKTQTGATLTLANHSAAWWYKRTGPTAGTCTSRTAAQTTAILTGLTAGTSYTYKAYSKTGCNAADVIATATFDTLNAQTLTATNKTQTGATLTLANHSAAWWYKRTGPTAGTCTSRTAAQTTATLTSLTAGTSYTYKAYSKTGCNTADVIATATFDTLNAQTPSPPTGFSGGGGTDVLYNGVSQTHGGSANFVNGHLLRVQYGSNVPSTRLVCGAGATLEFGWYASSALTTRLGTGIILNADPARVYRGDYTPSGGGEYQALAYCKTGTTYSTAVNLQGGNRKFTLNAPTLTVSNRTETGATLTIANHSAAWWYKQTGPTAGTCTSRTAAQTTVTLTGLTVNTSYTYKAYSKAGCNAADVIATAMFSTNLDQLPAPRLTGATPGNGQVTLTWNKVTGAAGYQYLVLNADKTRIVSTDWFSGSYGDQTSGIVTGLTNGREYHFQVRAMKRGPATRYIQWISGLWSNTRSARPEGPPPPVENIRVTPNGTSLTVTWDASLGATGYDVTYTDNSSGRTARAAWDHAGTSVTITCDSRYPGQNRDCVRSGTTYSVGVRAKGQHGPSEWRNSGRPPTAPQPQPPAGDACQTQLTGDGSVAGFWNERCDSAARRGRYAHYYSFTLAAQSTLTISLESRIDTYLLLRRGGQDGPVLHRNDDWGGSYDSRISETLAAGTYTIEATTYHRWEIGNFTLGVSGLGSTAPPQGTNPPPPVDESSAPDPVTNIRVRHNGTSLSVEWDASARATGYDVTYYDTGSRRNWRAAWNRAGTRLRITCDVRPEHSDEGCINSHTYTVGIRARNAAGTSAWTNSGRASEGGSAGSAAPAPALSVADATAAESSGSITFAVTLSPAAARWVYVDYSTHDGTASAGLDYTAGSGTLTFRPGETRKTVTLALLDDAYDEGSETLELMLSNAEGALLEDGLATGTITNDDPVPQAWISRFGRTVAHQALDAVEARMDSQPTPGLEMILAGQPVDWPDSGDESQPVAEQVVEQLAQWVSISSDGATGAVPSLQENDLLANSSFAFGSPTGNGGLFSFWGRGAVSNFEGREGDLTLDGQVNTWMLGTDWSWGQQPGGGEARRSTAGLMVSRSSSDGSYANPGSSGSGDVDATLTGVFPWARHRFTEQLEAWGAAGYGQGELEVTPKLTSGQDGATLTTDLNLWLAAAGLRGTLLDGDNHGITLTGKTDVMAVGTSSAQVTGANGNLAAAEATVTRLRLGLEAQRPFSFGDPEADSRATLTPSLELGLRHDGGDAETGFGLDLGGGITLSHPARGLQAELRGRGLLTHAAEGFRDQGFSGFLSWQQRPDSDLGAMLSLTQTMGGSSSGGADALLSRVNLEGLAANEDEGNGLTHQRLDLQLSYGFLALGDRFTLTPELGLGLYNSGRDYRVGWSLKRLAETGSLDLSFDVTRRESSKDGDAPEHGVELNLDTRF